MPSLKVTANTSAQTVAAERLDRVHHVKSITVDNDAGAADQIVRVQDVFTPAKTNGDSSPSETTVDRLRFTAIRGDVVVYNEQDLKGIECLGALKVLGDSVDTDCHISVGYESK